MLGKWSHSRKGAGIYPKLSKILKNLKESKHSEPGSHPSANRHSVTQMQDPDQPPWQTMRSCRDKGMEDQYVKSLQPTGMLRTVMLS